MNLLQIMMHGGWIMVPIVLCSIAVLALGISRFMTLNRTVREMRNFMRQWDPPPVGAEPDRFRSACKLAPDSVSQMSRIFDEGSSNGLKRNERIEISANNSIADLETGLATIATLAAVTPLVGFLGTVTGMIRAFMQIQNLGGNVNANVLAGGIWEALVTTAAGLAVGILALIIHNYLAVLVADISRMLERTAEIMFSIFETSDEV